MWELGVSKGKEQEAGSSGQEKVAFIGVLGLSFSTVRAKSS